MTSTESRSPSSSVREVTPAEISEDVRSFARALSLTIGGKTSPSEAERRAFAEGEAIARLLVAEVRAGAAAADLVWAVTHRTAAGQIPRLHGFLRELQRAIAGSQPR